MTDLLSDIVRFFQENLLQDTITLYTTIFVIVSAFILIGLERLYPYSKGQRFFREGFFNDFVLYTLAQSYILGLAFSLLVDFVDQHTGLQRLQLLSDVPVWALVLISLFAHDFYIYWFHRWMHNNIWLWRLHEAHHSTKEIDWLSGSRSHALEILINQTVEFGWLALLGAPAEALVIKGAISAVWGMWIHSNIDVNTGSLQYIINGPEMHRWHHSDKHEEAYNMNFATKFAFWDWMFKTAYLPKREKPQYYGIGDDFPKNFIKQFFFAFRKMD